MLSNIYIRHLDVRQASSTTANTSNIGSRRRTPQKILQVQVISIKNMNQCIYMSYKNV